ncbi:MAG: efflux RND transporter periplasmic adaptor subunit [candidate division Zixibacteria bacterium]|nr:efflux RND transporter periplasmic adaptor subunit [candidate division Zixibacteria bacterium]MDD5426334.1 efflux RND transporter periplasmic adaptor subunit [candidate division Zixibacteria bacterium]
MKKYIYIAAALLVFFGGYYGVNALFTTTYDIPTTRVDKGEFIVSVKASGRIDAKRNFTVSAPRIRSLQITWMAPEGSMVQKSDSIIKFDATQQLNDLTDNKSTLQINQKTLERAKKEYTIQEKQLKLELQKAERNYDEKKHEAPKLAEEAQLELELARLNFQAKMDQYKADVDKAELEVKRAETKVAMAQKELDQMTILAPIPGMVVYLEIWKGSSMGKVQEGDSPWPGQGLINLPDLSEMIVDAYVSEVDAAKVDTGQAVVVTLDAFPDKSYTGKVTKKATLARRKDYNSKINVFDVEVTINDEDENLKPGMSSSAKIIVNLFEDIVSVPLEAVFEKEGKTIVYLNNKKPVEVEVGQRNDMRIEILDGLNGGEEICLVDPTLEEPGLPGDKATEPELNKGRIGNVSSPPTSGRNRRR